MRVNARIISLINCRQKKLLVSVNRLSLRISIIVMICIYRVEAARSETHQRARAPAVTHHVQVHHHRTRSLIRLKFVTDHLVSVIETLSESHQIVVLIVKSRSSVSIVKGRGIMRMWVFM